MLGKQKALADANRSFEIVTQQTVKEDCTFGSLVQ